MTRLFGNVESKRDSYPTRAAMKSCKHLATTQTGHIRRCVYVHACRQQRGILEGGWEPLLPTIFWDNDVTENTWGYCLGIHLRTKVLQKKLKGSTLYYYVIYVNFFRFIRTRENPQAGLQKQKPHKLCL